MMERNFSEPTPATDRELSKPPEDLAFGNTFEYIRRNDPELANILSKVEQNPEQKIMIESELAFGGRSWVDLKDLVDDKPEARESFLRLVNEWNTKLEGNPKSKEDHKHEVNSFIKKLN